MAADLAQPRSEVLQGVIEAMIERILVVEKSCGSLPEKQRLDLVSLVGVCIPAANLLSKLDDKESSGRLQKLMQRQAQLVARQDPQSGAELAVVQSQITDDYTRTDDALRLTNRFVEAQAVFSRVLGIAILASGAPEEASLEAVRARLR